jgi:hypothetical protein
MNRSEADSMREADFARDLNPFDVIVEPNTSVVLYSAEGLPIKSSLNNRNQRRLVEVVLELGLGEANSTPAELENLATVKTEGKVISVRLKI